MGYFLKSLIIIIGVYYLVKLILKGILGSYMGKVNESLRQQYEEKLRQEREKAGKSGSVHVDYQPKNGKTFSKEDGEYVDFEEIK